MTRLVGFQRSRRTPEPGVGQVWLDLRTPHRTLTILEIRGTYAICAAYNHRHRKPRQAVKHTKIRADRLYRGAYQISVKACDGPYRTIWVGYIYLEPQYAD